MPRGVPNPKPTPAEGKAPLTDKPSVSAPLFLDFMKLVYRHDKTPQDLVQRAGDLHDAYLMWESRKAPSQTPG